MPVLSLDTTRNQIGLGWTRPPNSTVGINQLPGGSGQLPSGSLERLYRALLDSGALSRRERQATAWREPPLEGVNVAVTREGIEVTVTKHSVFSNPRAIPWFRNGWMLDIRSHGVWTREESSSSDGSYPPLSVEALLILDVLEQDETIRNLEIPRRCS
jgi:hypothetical protein